MGSDQRSQTSLTVGNSQISGRANNVVSDDAGNSDLMVRRKIRVSFKDIRASFRDLVDADGKIVSQRNAPTQPLNRGLNAGVWGQSAPDLHWVLSRYDIDLVPAQFSALMEGAGARGPNDGTLPHHHTASGFHRASPG